MEEMETDYADEDDESTPSLLEFMPPVVLLEIFKFLEWSDLCQLSRTCTKFRDICQSATLWLQLRRLDFRNCVIPDGDKILQVLKRTQNADTLILADVITDQTGHQEGSAEEQQENIVGADKFLLEVLRTCQHVKNLFLYMHEITDRAVEAISAKCTSLVQLNLQDSTYIQNQAIIDLVSSSSTLTNLHIENCRDISFLAIKHKDPTKQLNLTKISLIGLELVLQNVQDLIQGCPYLTHLDLSLSQHLHAFVGGISQGVRTAMDSLEELVLQNCDGLEEISVPYCPKLTLLNTFNCSRLREITASSPMLQLLMTGACLSLKKIEMAASDLKDVTCTEMGDLETLQLGSDSLQTLNIFKCTRLDADQLCACVKNKEKLTQLNIEGCKSIPPIDLDEKILPTFTGLQSLVYGGHSWNSVRLKSGALKKLTFASCKNTTGLPLNMPALEELILSKCRDFGEKDLFDSLLYGKLIPEKLVGLEILKDDSVITPPFSNNTGTPGLKVLKLHDMPGLHGDVLSHWLKAFSHMTVLELVCCNFITHLRVESLPSLVHLKVESCTKLNRLHVTTLQMLETLDVRWCSMVQTMVVSSNSLQNLDLTGTNFANLSVNCDKLRSLHLSGVCTQPTHTLCIRCCMLRELSVVKCDRLSDSTTSDILQHCPILESLTLVGSLSLGSLQLPGSMVACSLTGHRILREINVNRPVQIKHLTLNNLPKFTPDDRLKLLKDSEGTLRTLEVRAIRGETDLTLSLKNLTSLTLDQGIQLAQLSINCPQLQYLRIQGCPKLKDLTIHLDKLSQLQVYHSTPLLALRNLTLDCKKVTHLPRVLAYYCPKLEELTIQNCVIQFSQFFLLGQALPQLHTVNTASCDVINKQSTERIYVIQSSSLDRKELKDLVVNFDR